MGVKLEAKGGCVKESQPFGTAVYAAGASLAGPGAPESAYGAEGNADLGSRRPRGRREQLPGRAGRAASRRLLGEKAFHSVPFCSILFRFLSGAWDVLVRIWEDLIHEWEEMERIWEGMEHRSGRWRLRRGGVICQVAVLPMGKILARVFVRCQAEVGRGCCSGKGSSNPSTSSGHA